MNHIYDCDYRWLEPWQVLNTINFLWLGSGRVSHLWFGFGKFPLTTSNFPIFFSSDQKNLFGPGQRAVGPLFTVGQKYARVGSGPISTIYYSMGGQLKTWVKIRSEFHAQIKVKFRTSLFRTMSKLYRKDICLNL